VWDDHSQQRRSGEVVVKGTFKITDESEVAPVAADPTFGALEGLETCRILSPDDYDLWLAVLEVAAGTVLHWPEVHGEEGIYLLSGELDVAGESCPEGGAVIVESDVAVSARTTQPSRLVHVGSRTPATKAEASPSTDRHGVHIVGPAGWFVSGSQDRSKARWFSDGTCPTCQIAFFDVYSDEDPGRSRAHTHSADEIIYVISGQMRLGRRLVPAGTSLCISGGTRYAQSAGPGGCTFLNYRKESSQQQYYGPGEPDYLLPETALGRGGAVVGDVVHLHPAQPVA
jgi:hypothetical protein